ncbi:hypothetical protein BaRGS_00008803 [Batillaria attramentaria]|uniref:Receptor ligand binding region domain-containing protein n=1 Tax=Batillaria attramentaria TaxID=370345 RepID=A0ABD0LKE0_9CAEN
MDFKKEMAMSFSGGPHGGAKLSLLTSITILVAAVLCGGPPGCEAVDVTMAVLLPFDDSYLFSYRRVAPAIQMAIEELNEDPRLKLKHKLFVKYNDTKCNIAEGMDRAINFYIKQQVDVFMGPVCDFAVAPVARQARFWHIPMISCGAMALDFSKYRETTYQLLTRVGPVNFGSLSNLVSRQWDHFSWKKLKLLYSKDGQDFLIKGFCHLLTEALHYTLKDIRPDLEQDYFRLDEKHQDFEELLRDEVGLEYGGRWRSVDSKCRLPAVFALLLAAVLCGGPRACEGFLVRMGVLLPNDDRYLFSVHHVYPAIEVVAEFLNREPSMKVKLYVEYADTQCSIAQAMNSAIQLYAGGEVDVFLGPVCDFAVAPVARQARYWHIPMISCGAMALDFSKYRKTTYPLLTRVGPVNFGLLSSLVSRQWDHFGWKKLKLLYSKDGQDFVQPGFCHLLVEALHYTLKDIRPDLEQDYFRLDERQKDFEALLREEVGLEYGGR